jgi:hypothetical protein
VKENIVCFETSLDSVQVASVFQVCVKKRPLKRRVSGRNTDGRSPRRVNWPWLRLRASLLVLTMIAGVPAVSLVTSVATATPAAAVSDPSWWNGNCDANNHPGSYALGASYNGVKACGPGPFQGGYDYAVRFYSGAWGEYEWECVELVMRYMYQVYGIAPYSADAKDVVNNYGGTVLTKVANNGTSVPTPGDIVSQAATPSNSAGHTAIVTATSVDGNGNGTIAVMQQNSTSDGWDSISVSGRTLGSGVTGWLHKPSTTSVGTRLLGDVTGDGKADAVVKFSDSGLAMTAVSTGSSFQTPGSWAISQTVGANKYFLGDVNGDNKDDLLAFWNGPGQWYVSTSSGSGFWPETQWAMGQGIGSNRQFIADVNGDNKDDLVLFWASTGTWYVNLSNGSSFGSPVLWANGHGVGSLDQAVADFTGDGRADLGVYFSNGNWYVSTSGTNPPFGYNQWSAGHATDSNVRLAGDINGGGLADIAYYNTNGTWRGSISSGTGFYTPTTWALTQGADSTTQFLGDVNGDGKADEVTFVQSTGTWSVDISSGNGFYGPSSVWITGHGAES